MKQEKTDEKATFYHLEEGMTNEEIRNRLRNNAILAHQFSVGEGNKLIQFLERAIKHMETTHKWLQYMNAMLFLIGIVVIIAGLVKAFVGSNAYIGLILSGGGGTISLITILINAPLKRISSGITNLIQLETAFLGFIRVIGEVDSAFQMRFIESIYGESGSRLDVHIADTKKYMLEIVSTTMELIDKYLHSRELKEKTLEKIEAINQRMLKLENKLKTTS